MDLESKGRAFRDGQVDTLFEKHAESLSAAVSIVKDLVPSSLEGEHIGRFVMKQKCESIPAKETTLIDASLGMADAMREALGLSFPARVSRLDPVLANTVAVIAELGNGVVDARKKARAGIRKAAELVAPLTKELQALVHDFAKPIVGEVDFALFEVLVRAVGWRHSCLMRDLLFGFEPLGEVPTTDCLRPVEEPPPPAMTRESNVASFDEAVEYLTRKAKQASPDDFQDQLAVWKKSLKECKDGFCKGPLSRRQVESMFAGTEFGPRCIPAFGIWQKGSLRRIDDACRSGHNLLTRMRETIVCVSADLPADIAAEFYKYLSKDCILRLGTDDIASAYRVLQSASPQYNVAAVWMPKTKDGKGGRVMYFALRGFNFGLRSAPAHLATLMRPMMEFARKVMLVACDQFYDDVLVVDPTVGLSSAQTSLGFLFRRLGYPFAARKHERLRCANAFLGVVSDLSAAPSGTVLLRVKEKRRRKLIQELKDVADKSKLSPAHAARIRGKLYFTTSSAFAGIGRPALQAFTARQYCKSSQSALTGQLVSSISFFIELLQNIPAQRIPLFDSDEKPLYVWSDAMWELHKSPSGDMVQIVDEESGDTFYSAKAAIAFVVFDPSDRTWHECHAQIGMDVIRLMVPGKKSYIGQLEALAAAAVLSSMPTDRTAGKRMLFWIDNLAAKYGLQKGYSKVDDSGRIINAFKVMQANLGLRIHFEYVPSEQNVADLPSRGAFAMMREVIEMVFGSKLVRGQNFFEHDFVLPSFETWNSPLAKSTKKRKMRSGSRGTAKRKAFQVAAVPTESGS
jgi:hypothetical protein